jgi:photosystem II stability/assembly factor-like uncharacterized protein
MHQQAGRVRSMRWSGMRSLWLTLAALGCGVGAPSSQAQAQAQVAAQADALKARPPSTPKLTPQQSGTSQGLIGISAASAEVVWASGRGGTFAVTGNGGASWRSGVVPGAESLQLRDVEAVSEREAFVLSIGTGTDSRIYRTVDGGKTWTMQFQNQDPNGFYDCFAFWDARAGLTMADSIGARFPVVRTLDGRTWQDIGDRLPAALPGEAGFASSGTCAATLGPRRAWLTTGGTATARVLITTDRGQTWSATTAPLSAGPAGGGFSIAFRDARHGVLGGGDLLTPADVRDNFARSHDGGKSWQLGTAAPIPGAIYGLAYAQGRHRGPADDDGEGQGHDGAPATVVATAPAAAAWSSDEGTSWTLLDGVSGYWAVDFADAHTGWLVGVQGQILRIDL